MFYRDARFRTPRLRRAVCGLHSIVRNTAVVVAGRTLIVLRRRDDMPGTGLLRDMMCTDHALFRVRVRRVARGHCQDRLREDDLVRGVVGVGVQAIAAIVGARAIAKAGAGAGAGAAGGTAGTDYAFLMTHENFGRLLYH